MPGAGREIVPGVSRRRFTIGFVALGAAALVTAQSRDAQAGPIMVRRPNEVELAATVHRKQFDSGSMPGYHAIVWRDGRSAHSALLEADVSDRQVIRALEELGARPGNNLSMDAWDERRNPGSPAPDVRIAGPPIQVLLGLPGRPDLVPLSTVLEDSGGKALDLRYGGNERNIPKWKSGCIVCLYSCPGSKIGNAAYTERDYVRNATRFRIKEGVLPPDGTVVRVVLRVAAATR